MLEDLSAELYKVLKIAVQECNSNCISLSGGLDSAILAYFLKSKKPNAIAVIAKDFVATDLTYCQMIASKFDLPLCLKTVTTEELFSAIEETIKILKNFNSIEIRNSIVMYLALTTVKASGYNSLITGDGADELFAGYNFLIKKSKDELQNDLERIWEIMHFPATKIGRSFGVKIESPFLNDKVTELAKKMPPEVKVKEENGKKYGKWILRKTFEDKIPTAVVWRDKSPMQDGAGTSGLISLFNNLMPDNMYNTKSKKIKDEDNVIINSKESLYYYEIYRKYNEAPHKLQSSNTHCPYCKYDVKPNSKFCRMCGSYPI